MHFSYSADFARHVFVCLSSVEFAALKLLLGAQPQIGSKVLGSRNSRGLDYCGCVVHYSYEPLFRDMYLFDIEQVDWFGERPRTFLARVRNLFRL